jgi:Cu/Ag efflux pump CusA
VFFAKGLTATFLHPVALAFALAVVASTVIAFTFTPALGMLLFDRGRPRRHTPGLVTRIGTGFERIVERALRLPPAALACVCLIGLAGAIAVPVLRQPSAPRFEDRNLIVQWDGPAGAGLTEMDRITARAIGYLKALPSVSDVAATLGRAVSADQIVDTSSGQIYVALKPSADYDGSVNAVRAVVQSVPGMHASVSTYESDVEAGVLAPAGHDLTVRVYGEDYAQLRSLASQVRGLMSTINGLGPAGVQLPAQEPSIQVAVDDAAALRAGVLPGDARRQASTLVSGLTVGNFFEDQAVFDVVVLGVRSVRSNVADVRNLLIDTSGGGHVRLGSIARVNVRSGAIDIEHEAL